MPDLTLKTTAELAKQYSFFHWHLQFPQVFAKGGFDVVLGNPPWDTLSPDAKEFFSQWDTEVRSLSPDDQASMIRRLLEDSAIASAWNEHCRTLYAEVAFMKESGRYKLFAPGNLGKGDFNIFRIFVEMALASVRQGGRASQVVPEGLYCGANCMKIREELFERCQLESVLGFENSAGAWFPGVHRSQKFSTYVAKVPGHTDRFSIAFNIRTVADLARATSGGTFELPVDIVREFSPETLALMEFRSQHDIDIAAKMYAAHPKFGDDGAGPPYRHYMAEVHMGNNRDLFTEDPAGMPLYEGRMVTTYDHRAKGYRSGRGRQADWQDLPFSDRKKSIQPQWRILPHRVPDKARRRLEQYRVGWCDVTGSTNARTLLATLIPCGVLCGDSVPNFVFEPGFEWSYLLWLATANSYCMDFIVRMKVTSHVKYTHLDSLPFPRLSKEDWRTSFVVPRVARLVCVGSEMVDYWNGLALDGWVGPRAEISNPPGELDEDRRFLLQSELDAFVAKEMFGLTGEELSCVLDTFPIVEKRDRKAHSDYRTKRVILEIYDAMVEAARAGKPYKTRPDPLPADPRAAHPGWEVAVGWAASDFAALPDAVWERPRVDMQSEAGAAIAAVLRAVGSPTPARFVRLAAILSLDPRLLLASLKAEEATTWRRLVGNEAVPSPPGVAALVPPEDRAWGAAVRHLRGNGLLVEDSRAKTWAPGPGLNAIETDGWPDGRARFVLGVLGRRDERDLMQTLPDVLQRWVDAAAA